MQLQDIKNEHLEMIKKLESEVNELKCDLDQMTKSVKMLNNGSETLDKILQAVRVVGDMSGLGYNGTKKSSTEYAQSQAESKMSNQMF